MECVNAVLFTAVVMADACQGMCWLAYRCIALLSNINRQLI